MTHARVAGRRATALLAGTGLLVSAAIGTAGAAGAAGGPASAPPTGVIAPASTQECPDAFPVDELTRGQVLSGLTVARGTQPKPFLATVIGVLNDGIAPGLDMVMVDTSSADITAAGGIWAGMSGSPVYAADGRLVGAVAYGLAMGASPVAGITPADAMYALRASDATPKDRVALPKASQQALVAAGGATAREAAGGLSTLPVPVGISGVSVARAQRFADRIDSRLDLSHAFATGSARAANATSPIIPGGNAAVALSYGDYTAAAVGTTTAVCDQQALLFGHPFLFEGSTTMSLHSADALYVQRDQITPFKVANPGGVVGTVTQDRLAGLGARLDSDPPSASVVSTLRNVTTGGSRTGTTRVVTSSYLADLAAFHTLVNAQRVLDSAGDGVARFTWTASGTSGGKPWSVSRSDVLADRWDIGFMLGFALYDPLWQINDFPRAAVTVDSVTLTGSLDETYRDREITKVQVKVGKKWVRVGGARVPAVKAGKPAKVRVTTSPWKSSRAIRTVITVPKPPRGFGYITVTGGGMDGFYFDEDFGVATPATLPRLLTSIADQARGDEIVVTWDGNRTVEVTKRLPQFVTGYVEGEVSVG